MRIRRVSLEANASEAALWSGLILSFRTFPSITFGSWSKHDGHIGAVELPPDVDEADFVGAEKETRYVLIVICCDLVGAVSPRSVLTLSFWFVVI
jgi:hypothetical protein